MYIFIYLFDNILMLYSNRISYMFHNIFRFIIFITYYVHHILCTYWFIIIIFVYIFSEGEKNIINFLLIKCLFFLFVFIFIYPFFILFLMKYFVFILFIIILKFFFFHTHIYVYILFIFLKKHAFIF